MMGKQYIPKFLLSWYHLGWAFFGALRYGFPGYGMTVIGVTGTNGKSTTVDMISRVLREGGIKECSLSSIRFEMQGKEERNTLKMTMPGRFFIQKFMRKAKNAGCTHMVLEVTSEGILQNRHKFISFYVAVFTNLSPEHIERHGSFENYKKAKGELFKAAKNIHIINGDDENSEYFLSFPAREKWIYGLKISNRTNPMDQAKNTKYPSTEFTLRTLEGLGASKILDTQSVQFLSGRQTFFVGGTGFSLKLLGEFNVYNALAAIAVGRVFNVSLENAKRALEAIEKMPGRMEEVIFLPFRVIVDYAFTPVALEKVYKTLKPQVSNPNDQVSAKAPFDGVYPESTRGAKGRQNPNAKLICVLGAAGGGRDKWKRPVLGKLAGELCDKVIITNEDPYEEDPSQILSQIKSGISNDKFLTSNFYEIMDRREAIAKAFSLAKSGDTVVITGKGSEDSIAVAGGKKIPWDDRVVVKEEFAKRKTP